MGFLGLTSYENIFRGLKNRFLQNLARSLPGHSTIRVWCHRARGVHIGNNVFIGTDVIIDTSTPEKISIGDNVIIGIRCTLISHMDNKGLKQIKKDKITLRIENDVFIGPGVIILPDLIIGQGSVLSAGCVISKSVPPHTMMQGNPAKAVAKCGIPLTKTTEMWDFYRHLTQIKRNHKC